MTSLRQGSLHLFRFAGVDVFLHWSWFLVAAIEIEGRAKSYSSITWNLCEYLALFLIVLVHEYGHALACRQVGGTANRIVLWPLGGVAYVNPPQRPGATLWSIAAGPLVNVGFLIVLSLLGVLNRTTGWADAIPNAHAFLRTLADDQPRLADLQFAAHLSAGRRPDSTLAALVCPGPRSQLNGCGGGGIYRRGRPHRFCLVDANCLDGHSCRIHPHELLGRTATCASPRAFGQAAAARGICLSLVRDRAAGGSFLEVQSLRAGLRYLPNPGHVPEL